jgi:putative transposase
VSNDNPYGVAQFKTLKYCPAFPERFGSIQDARAFCETFVTHYNHAHVIPRWGYLLLLRSSSEQQPTSAHTGPSSSTPPTPAPERFGKPPTPPKLPTAAWINPPTPAAQIQPV